MKVSELHPSKYIKADELRGKPHLVVISHLAQEEVAQGERKWVIYFQGKPKGLVLNVTNSKRLAMFLGDETNNWTGKEAVIYPELTQDKSGNPVWGCRLRPPDVAQAAPPIPPKSENPAADMSDDIPF